MADDNQLAVSIDGGNLLAAGVPALPELGFGAGPSPAVVTGIPSNYASAVARHESGGDPNAENPYFPVARGGPLGPHQFIRSTWQSFVAANPQIFAGMTPDQIDAARTDPRLSAAGAQWYAAQNATHLQGAGILPTPGNLAIAHALGPAGAVGVLRFPDETPLSKAFVETQPRMAEAILRENPSYQKMSVGDLKAKYAALDKGQYTPSPATSAPAAAPRAPSVTVNQLSSLNGMQNTPLGRLMMYRQLAELFRPQQQRQQQAASAGPQTGGVDASIPLRVV